MMDFINDLSTSNILKDPNTEHPTRLISEDIGNKDIKVFTDD
jgi:hypothetical protein